MRTTTPKELSRRLDGFAGRLQDIQRNAVTAAALEATKVVRSEIRAATGGDMRLSGVGKRGVKVNAAFNLLGHRNPTAMVFARGPLQLVERNTKPRRIPRPRQRRRGKRRVIVIPGVGVRASANHPGTRGKHPFEKGQVRAIAPAKRAFHAEVSKSFRKSFG